MTDTKCNDCGEQHRTGAEALACDVRMFGWDNTLSRLARLGVRPEVIQRVSIVGAEGKRP